MKNDIKEEIETPEIKDFPISDINGEQIGSNFIDEKGEIIKTEFLFRVKRIDGTIENPEIKKGYIEFVDSDYAIRFSPEPESEIEQLTPETPKTKKTSKNAIPKNAQKITEEDLDLELEPEELLTDKEILGKIIERLSAKNPFYTKITRLLTEAQEKM